jgi:hypothetical protein
MKSQPSHLPSRLLLGMSVLLVSQIASAQSRSAISIVGLTNDGYIYSLDQTSSNGSQTVASANHSFTGLDSEGNSRTMDMSGQTIASSEYGQLKCYTTLSVNNSYYNAANSPYADPDGNLNDPNGSPKSLTSLAFAIFDDVLHFGGNLQAGYKARYIFHIEGDNYGTSVPYGDGGAADLVAEIGGDAADTFFDFDPGYFNGTWATSDHEINGITPESIHVQFSNQVVFNLPNYLDGSNLDGTSDFSSTVTLVDIEVVDENGNYVTGWWVTSDSGTNYPTMKAVPEPTSMAALGLGALAMMRRRRK